MYLVVFAALTILSVSALLYPLLRRGPSATVTRADYDNAVYRSQLAEVVQEAERGLMNQEQADAARTEIHRRMLSTAAVEKKGATGTRGSRRASLAAAIAIALSVPTGAGLLYAAIGSPGMPDQPYAERLKRDPNVMIASAARKLAAQLANKPNATGYLRLAEIYFYLHDYGRSATAYQQAIDLGDKSAGTWSQLGETIVMANDGAVVPDAINAFAHALQVDAREPRARYYFGLAAAQAHEWRRAVAIWRDLEKDSAANAPWLPILRQHIAAYAKAGGFDPASITPEPPLLPNP
ncbi:MAG: c-type cytochrome biogenesis protein CcmI [Alphaproteobacteria bacterium]|nr:c-type cytochrome biogenesis protein CcmI [Alphaproteobacteria bacterium]MDE2111144.1 c-type cytochrome biogenesis protein CcmI [Alphaproteobacteria bacterium]MDE2495962.1 c-type cytochrome biogenesis protein CcmI [Alphaproteobacteria bacterium]